MKKNQIIISIIILLLVGGISFYAGTKVGGGNSSANNKGGQFSVNGSGNGIRTGRGGQGMMGGAINGEVLNKDATSITVKLRDGGSKIVFLSTSTAVQKTTTGTIADIVVGSQITANGQANADGSINATTINQRPNVPVQGGIQGAGAR